MSTPQQKILYITDTHLGASLTEGYFMQPRCLDVWDQILESLRTYVKENQIDLVLHGGDLIDTATNDLIKQAANDMRSLGVPVQLCLGNHDLDKSDALKRWLEIAPDLFPQSTHTSGIKGEHANIFIIGHHYASNNPPHFWDMTKPEAQIPIIDVTQRATLELFTNISDKPVIIVTHCPVHGISSEQTGNDIFHPANQPYAQYLINLAQQSGKIPLILSAHNHVSSVTKHHNLITMTTGSFTEAPCTARLLTINQDQMTVDQINFAEQLKLTDRFDNSNAWVGGTPSTQSIKIKMQIQSPQQPQQSPSSMPPFM
ncbi:metallophosphoesterase [Planctomycetota bacterium]|nr:metallophosphoesterase [Planctomycetota bacterium]